MSNSLMRINLAFIKEIFLMVWSWIYFSAKSAKKAYHEELTLKEAALVLDFVTEEEYQQWIDPIKMTYSR